MRSARRGLASALALLALPIAAHAAAPAAARPIRHLVTFVVEVPATTPEADVIFVSGSDPALGEWLVGGLRLTPRGGRRHTGTVRLEYGAKVHFVITRGTIETVERDARGGEVAHREYDVSGDDTVRVVVATWRDRPPAPAPRARVVTGDVRLHAEFPSRFVRPRDVHVWLPPGYAEDPAARYPVLYFHDGQNVLDASTSAVGVEWGLDETATRLIVAGTVRPFIAVCVANTSDRAAEYAPAPGGKPRGGDAYARFLIEELKPFVDRTYRTRPEPAHTGSAGSSLGAIAALRLALDRPEVFALAGGMSPAVKSGPLAAVPARTGALRVWLDVGTAEGADAAARQRAVEQVRALGAALVTAGLREGADLHLEVVEGGRAGERDWGARLERMLPFLLGPPERAARSGD
jgi:predicted alpha/beta superfamily hydrolase